MINLNPLNHVAKCAGEAPDGTHKCAYRESCARFVRPVGNSQEWAEFWRAGTDCPQYESLPRVEE